MYKETGRIDVNVAGIVSDISNDKDEKYIIVDGGRVYINHSSASLFSKIKSGEYAKLKCYLSNGKVFATDIE